MLNFRILLPLLALLALATVAAAAAQPAVTTAPIYLPHYDKKQWSLVRGSVIASNTQARQTTYTIFCVNDNPPECDISLEFPFIIVEGPDTVEFHGTYTSTYIANLGCALKGTTAATCSGYSSYKAGYTNGLYKGPTEVSWTTTYSGSQVEWGVLTMAEVPEGKENQWDVTATAELTPTTISGHESIPIETNKQGASDRLRVDKSIALLGVLGSTALMRLLF